MEHLSNRRDLMSSQRNNFNHNQYSQMMSNQMTRQPSMIDMINNKEFFPKSQTTNHHKDMMREQRSISLEEPKVDSNLEETNQFIDAICSLSIDPNGLEWIWDMEVGPTSWAAKRHIAYYDTHKHIVMSASQPNTVHPGFLRCPENFRALLVYSYETRHQVAKMNSMLGSVPPITHGEMVRRNDLQKKLIMQQCALKSHSSY